MSMTFKQFLMNEGVAEKSASGAQAVWAEKDPQKKYEKAKEHINTLKFKDKIPKHLASLEKHKGNGAKIDNLVAQIQLKGEGHGVAK